MEIKENIEYTKDKDGIIIKLKEYPHRSWIYPAWMIKDKKDLQEKIQEIIDLNPPQVCWERKL